MSLNQADAIVKKIDFETGGSIDFQNAKSLLRIQVKTADYTVLESDSGTRFTTHGDSGAIIFTLPANPKRGLHYQFVQSTDQSLTVTADTADTLITHDNLAADGVAFSTGSNQIGQMIEVFADGNAWYALQQTAGTFTVTDA